MKTSFLIPSSLLAFCFLAGCKTNAIAEGQAASEATVSTLTWDIDWLNQLRLTAKGESDLEREAFTTLLQHVDIDLNQGPFTIVNKTVLPVSGDPHDYFSMGPYWWPNPDTEDGLPYVRRDGEWNSENNKDSEEMGRVVMAVRRLGVAYYLTEREIYAEKAASLLRTFFLDEETRMNPHLMYAQAVPGQNDGRHIGMIDPWQFPSMLESVVLLRSSPEWPEEDHAKMQQWVSDFLDWYLESEFGEQEANYRNNHSTWYYAQIGGYALFADRPDVVREEYPKAISRLVRQIDSRGRQPHELDRTRSLHYSLFNLKAFVDIAETGSAVGLDYWDADATPGREIKRALDYLLPYLQDLSTWTYPEQRGPEVNLLLSVYRLAGNKFGEQAYLDIAEKHPPTNRNGYFHRLVYPSEIGE